MLCSRPIGEHQNMCARLIRKHDYGCDRPIKKCNNEWGVTKTPAICPASKTPAQPCLYYENACYRKITKTPTVEPRS